MKKYVVLGVLFILPIAVYLFFASGVNNFGKLPVLNEQVQDVNAFSSEGNKISLHDKITVLGFLGENVNSRKLNAFNLNQKIYKRFNGFKDFQFVFLSPEGTEEFTEDLKKELAVLADVTNWNFVFTSEETIKDVFQSLQTPYKLDENLYTPYVFIIDKEAKLRGRIEEFKEKGKKVSKNIYGYDATSVAVLNNEMIDDIKVLLAEYRMATKKNGVSDKESYLKYNKKKNEE